MIAVKAVQRKNFATGEKLYYPQIAPTSVMELNDIAEGIEQRTTLSRADVKAVLDSLQLVVKDAMLDGKSIRFVDLGSFRPTLSTKSQESADKVTADTIKAVHVRFRPSTAFKNYLSKQNVEFKMVK